MELLVNGVKFRFSGVSDYDFGGFFVWVKHSEGCSWFATDKVYAAELKKGKVSA